ncbi:MAG: hypothetical protein IT384_13715 [Deltaproteobacteria bacterium]|nr:hypothetical protein [Deltaproteobacteria bacterium]
MHRAPERWITRPPEDPRERRAANLLERARPTELGADGVARVRRRIARSISIRAKRRRRLVLAAVAASALATAGIAAAAPGVWTAIARELGWLEAPPVAAPARTPAVQAPAEEAPALEEPRAPAKEAPALEEPRTTAKEASPPSPVLKSKSKAPVPTRPSVPAAPLPLPAPAPPTLPAPAPATTDTASRTETFPSELKALEPAVTARNREDWDVALQALARYARAYPRGALRSEAQLLELECDLRLDRTDDALQILEAIDLEGHPRREELEALRHRLSARRR